MLQSPVIRIEVLVACSSLSCPAFDSNLGIVLRSNCKNREQVNDLKVKQSIEDAARQKLLEYINEIRSACDQPFQSKPPPNHWQSSDYFSARTDSLRAYGLEIARAPQKQLAEEVC